MQSGAHLFVRLVDDVDAVDFDDAVADAHAAALRDPAAQQRADHAVLHREAQLVLDIRPLRGRIAV